MTTHSEPDLSTGVTLIDTDLIRPGFAASYLVVDDASAAFVETGCGHSTARLLAALAEQKIPGEAVEWVVVTHVHLDHASGAGALMRQLPRARLVVHPRGAAHMADPSRLMAGAAKVYGERVVSETYGAVLPIAADRIVEAEDRMSLQLGRRTLTFLHTPGHASHHLCVFDSRTEAFFSGDAFGLAYRELAGPRGPFIFPTTTPARFDPEKMHASIDRLLSYKPEAIYLTHFGKVTDPGRLAAELHTLIDQFVTLAREARAQRGDASLAESLMNLLCSRLAERQHPADRTTWRSVLEMDMALNAQGLQVWLDHTA